MLVRSDITAPFSLPKQVRLGSQARYCIRISLPISVEPSAVVVGLEGHCQLIIHLSVGQGRLNLRHHRTLFRGLDMPDSAALLSLTDF
ncbi:hypothetical protein J6590_037490 [Homalodisca vitripennis]|nr:hypothetical protein J6590_037490 [Homalodisca vitripennis]